MDVVSVETIEGKRSVRRPVNVYSSQLDRAIIGRSYELLRFYDCYRSWVM